MAKRLKKINFRAGRWREGRAGWRSMMAYIGLLPEPAPIPIPFFASLTLDYEVEVEA